MQKISSLHGETSISKQARAAEYNEQSVTFTLIGCMYCFNIHSLQTENVNYYSCTHTVLHQRHRQSKMPMFRVCKAW